MKKYFLYVAACMLSLGGMMSACSDDDDPSNGNGNGAVEEIDITKDNASNWYSYMINVANLLKEDATTLYNDWKTSYNGGESYASIFINHNNSAYFGTANNCVQQIIEGCCMWTERHKTLCMRWNLGSAGIPVRTIPIISFPFTARFAVREM